MDRLDVNFDGMAGRADDVYEALLAAHQGLDGAASAALNARLVLLLANMVGDPDAVIGAILAAKGKS